MTYKEFEISPGDRIRVTMPAQEPFPAGWAEGKVISAHFYVEEGWYIEMDKDNVSPGWQTGYGYVKQREDSATIEKLSSAEDVMESEKVPEYLLKRYPYLEGAPKSIWIKFWEFLEEPPELGGSLPWALKQVEEIYQLRLTKEGKYLRWAEIVTDKYYSGLLTEDEKTEYLQWEFGW